VGCLCCGAVPVGRAGGVGSLLPSERRRHDGRRRLHHCRVPGRVAARRHARGRLDAGRRRGRLQRRAAGRHQRRAIVGQGRASNPPRLRAKMGVSVPAWLGLGRTRKGFRTFFSVAPAVGECFPSSSVRQCSRPRSPPRLRSAQLPEPMRRGCGVPLQMSSTPQPENAAEQRQGQHGAKPVG
jgi:hypothetical protein